MNVSFRCLFLLALATVARGKRTVTVPAEALPAILTVHHFGDRSASNEPQTEGDSSGRDRA
jgi:hypothetical protein